MHTLRRLCVFALLAMPITITAAAQEDDPTGAEFVVFDLTPQHDDERVIENPHKGWYHHYPDNALTKYRIKDDDDLLEFPGMDHLYLRLAWSYLEPEEGKFNWEVIDEIIEKWTAHGLGYSFRISCHESSVEPIEQQFATPRWVFKAGAKGGHYRDGQSAGDDAPWEPVYDDPVFMEKLEQFLRAFAARYDGRPALRYVDIGSFGVWGEGHTHAGSRTSYNLAQLRPHVDLYLKYFKESPLVISDDFVYSLSDPDERKVLHEYLVARGVTYRDDSILVDWYVRTYSRTWSVRSPELFADAWRRGPNVLELQHYHSIKRNGNWTAQPGSSAAEFGGGRTGPDFFRGALQTLHATYIGYHGDAADWLADNPELTRELANRCGYWLFPVSVELPPRVAAGDTMRLKLAIENRGVAPPYAPYALRVKLTGPERSWTTELPNDVRRWLPGKAVERQYAIRLPADMPPNEYSVSIGLFDESARPERVVEFALREELRDADGYFRVGKVTIR